MAKKQGQTVTRQEFDTISGKVDCIIAHLKAFEERNRKQQQGIEEILSILHCTFLKYMLGSFIKTAGALTASITAILYFFQNIKGWLHK